MKHRATSATRVVPAAPELVRLLRQHVEEHGAAGDGRLFVRRYDQHGPVSKETYSRVWRQARAMVLTESQQRSPLAKVPYHLRHAAVSLWLNAGVPATQVAEWAGHSVNVLLKVYAKCIDGDATPPVVASRRRCIVDCTNCGEIDDSPSAPAARVLAPLKGTFSPTSALVEVGAKRWN
ncbi:tyrosine-type recombinase/integrase [Dactylosporangium sp. CA-139066]|uniref:tyrosine-type recombinase/integrase n=1 Tax=Dactylosporangium sp. CA-139066 TaxID=3239930 RepID=UPI003D900C5A